MPLTTNRAFGGDVTTNSYAWDATVDSGLGVAGGWRQTTTYANGKQTIEVKDTFGRLTSRTDMGGNVATTSYDQAGRIATISGLENQSFTWLNTGLLATQTSDLGSGSVRSVATFGYDQVGNRATETFTRDGVVYRRSEAIFDMQNRMRSWADTGDSVPTALMSWLYDKNGNIIRTYATFATLNRDGSVRETPPFERWFRFDSMNRMTLDGGRMGANGIERGDGTEITYRVDGSRATALTSFLTYASVFDPDYEQGGRGEKTVEYRASRRDSYEWRDDGQLLAVTSEDTGYIDNGDGTASEDGVYRLTGSAGYEYDVLGRLTRQTDRGGSNEAIYDRTLTYDGDGRGQIVAETTVTKQGTDTVNTTTSSEYGTGTDYALGAVLKVTSTTTVNGGNSTTTTSSNSYDWRDGAQLTGTVTTKTNANTAYTSYTYSGVGQLETVSIGGDRSRTVTFINDLAGQVIRRAEADDKPNTGDPLEIWYRHGGREIGYVGNNGSASASYQESINRRGLKPDDKSTFAPLGGQPRGSHFAETIDRINSFETGSAGRSYTVQVGDTLSGIADQVWGDASLWYKLATANGLGADSVLVAGQVLTVPAGVVRSTYNADTYKPYDPTDVLGDVNPNPKAKRGNKCGGFGRILLAAVAIAVTAIATAGIGALATGASFASTLGAVMGGNLAAFSTAAVGSTLTGGVIAGAATIGGAMIGNAASQGLGIAMGMQDRFSWSGMAMAGLTAGVGPSGNFFGGGVGGAVANGLVNNTIQQGLAIAKGQQSRFDWAGLAAAGVSSGVGWSAAGNGGSMLQREIGRYAAGIAGTVTRSILTQTSFGDNILAVLPDMIGATIGELAIRGVSGLVDRLESPANRQAEPAIISATKQSQSRDTVTGSSSGGGGADDSGAAASASTKALDGERYIVTPAVMLPIELPAGAVPAVDIGDETVVTGDPRRVADSGYSDFILPSWIGQPANYQPTFSLSSRLGSYVSAFANPIWQYNPGYNYAGRDYRSRDAAIFAGMPGELSPETQAYLYDRRRKLAGWDALGLAPYTPTLAGLIAFNSGASPETIHGFTSIDLAFGEVLSSAAMRPIARSPIVGASRPGLEPLSGRLSGLVEKEAPVVWNNGWRTADGKFASPAGTGRAGGSAEAAVWDAIEAKPGWNVIRGHVAVRDASGQLRYYDGVAISPRGRVIGLETKSGTAIRTPKQREFDSTLNSSPSNVARGVGQSKGITVQRSTLIRMP